MRFIPRLAVQDIEEVVTFVLGAVLEHLHQHHRHGVQHIPRQHRIVVKPQRHQSSPRRNIRRARDQLVGHKLVLCTPEHAPIRGPQRRHTLQLPPPPFAVLGLLLRGQGMQNSNRCSLPQVSPLVSAISPREFLSLEGTFGGEFVEELLSPFLSVHRGVRGGHGSANALLDAECLEARLRGGAGEGQIEESHTH